MNSILSPRLSSSLRVSRIGLLLIAGAASAHAQSVTNWQSRAVPFPSGDLEHVAFGNGAFIALGSDGGFFRSADGIGWFRQVPPVPFNDLRHLDFLNGIFFVTEPLMTSFDGVVWTNHTGLTPSKLAFGNGVFVGVDQSSILFSTNGLNWKTVVTDPRLSAYDIAFGNNLFVILADRSQYAVVLSSPDGQGWTYRRHEYNEEATSIVFGNGRFVIQGDFGYSTNGVWTNTLVSTDGAQWESFAGRETRRVSFQNGLFLSSTDRYTNGVETAVILSSVNGITWDEHVLGTNYDSGYDFDFAYGLNTFVAVSSDLILQSAPLTNGSPIDPPFLTLDLYPGLTISGAVGQTYRIESTENLVATNSWQLLTNITLTVSPFMWCDWSATNRGKRFYRAVLQ